MTGQVRAGDERAISGGRRSLGRYPRLFRQLQEGLTLCGDGSKEPVV
jgi:hypothetical protein